MRSDLEKTLSSTACVGRLHRLGTRRLTRAHLALQRRPGFCAAMASVATEVSCALAEQLGCPVEVTGRLIERAVAANRALADGRTAVFALFELDALGAMAVLEVERAVLTAALGRLSGGPSAAAPSSKLTRIEEASLGFLLLVALKAARQNETSERCLRPRLLSVNPGGAAAVEALDANAAHLVIQLRLSIAGVEGEARLFFSAPALQSALNAEDATVDGEMAPQIAQAGLSVRTFVGRTQLDTSDLLALQIGDVVLFEGLALNDGAVQGGGRLSSYGFEVAGAFCADGFQPTRVLSRAVPPESPVSRLNENDETSMLPVEVEIELTRLRLTVGELASIRLGTILPLRINATEPVTLRIGDRAVARAELVEIEGEVGARILTLLS